MYCHGHHGAAPREPLRRGRDRAIPRARTGRWPGMGSACGSRMGRSRGRTTCRVGMGRLLGRTARRTGMGPEVGRLLGGAARLLWCSFLERSLPGRSLLGRLLSVLCNAARDRPGSASRVCATGAATRAGLLLVLLPEPSGLLPVCQRVSAGLDEGCSFSTALGPTGVMVR